MSKWAMANPMVAQFAYFSIAASMATWAGLDVFRYRSDPNSAISGNQYYAVGVFGSDQNWWELSSMIRGFGVLAIWGLAALTQLLAIFGIASSANFFVWMFIVGGGSLLLGLSVGALRFLAYEQGYAKSLETPAVANGAKLMEAVKWDALMDLAAMGVSTLALYRMYDDWILAQWMGLSAEEQQVFLADLEDTVQEKNAQWTA